MRKSAAFDAEKGNSRIMATMKLVPTAAEVCHFVGLRTNQDCQKPPAWRMAQGRGSKKYTTPLCGTHRREMLNIGVPKSEFIPLHDSKEGKRIG